ncbi:MAG: hypothetical protein ABIR50_10250 [Ginsengibacter sp.]
MQNKVIGVYEPSSDEIIGTIADSRLILSIVIKSLCLNNEK